MRVLVTGATGFTGSHAMAELLRAGHGVRALVRSAEKLERTADLHGVKTPEAVVGDVTDSESVSRALDGCDAVLHTAAVVSIEKARGAEVVDTNVRGTELVIGGAVERGVRRIVHLSSVGALDLDHQPLQPDSPVARWPSAYSRSKAAAESQVRRWRSEGASIATLYPSAILGPGDPGLSESMWSLALFLNACIFHTEGGYQAVDVRDLARAQRALLEGERSGGFLAPGHYHEWRELGDLLERISGGRVRRIPAGGRLLRGLGRLGDLAKRVVPFDFPMTHEAMSFATRTRASQNSPELGQLGVEFRPSEETFEDGLRFLVERGEIPSERVPRLAAG